MRLRAVVLVCVLALGFVAGRVSAASDGSQLTGAGFAPVAAPGPSVGPLGAQYEEASQAWVAQLAERRSAIGQPEVAGSNPALGGGAFEESVGGTLELPAAVIGGVASYVAASYGPRYLALPEGPGHRVTICAKSRCVVRVSTDAGPDLAMQRAGRVADLSFADFRYLCRCNPPSVGLIRVTVQRGGAVPRVTLPPTDSQ